MDKKIGIYCIENLFDGKKYVGQSVDIDDRLRGHRYKLRKGIHPNLHLQASWNIYCKHNEHNFKFYVLEECSKDMLDDREQYYISKWKLQDKNFGYNVEPGGTKNKAMSEESKTKISQSLKGRPCPDGTREWIIEYNKTRKFTEETKQKMSDHHYDCQGSNNPRCISVYCPELDELFWGAKEAETKYKDYGVRRNNISRCINGKAVHAGKHPVTGMPLSWTKIESKNC